MHLPAMVTLSLLPEDIQVEIFMKLPAKTISICRCVCKIWYSLLCNPKFVKNHLTHTIQTKKNLRRPMVLSTFDKCEWNGDIQMDYPFDAETIIYSLKVVGSCNGLVCLINIFNGELIRSKDDRICIWNPTTREYKEVSLPPYDSLVKEDCYNIRYGFGYASATDNYKVVRISGHRKSPNCLKMQVYALGSDSWKYIDDSISYSFNDFRSRCTSFGLFFHGALHWIGESRKRSSDVIVTFGISNERLMDVPSIEKPIGGWGGLEKEVGLLGDCLSLAVAVIFARLDVWVMKEYGVRESWTKLFTITQDQIPITRDSFFKPIWSSENDDQILMKTDKNLILYDQTNGRVRMVCFLDTTMRKKVVILLENGENYVESLVSLKSGTYVERKSPK